MELNCLFIYFYCILHVCFLRSSCLAASLKNIPKDSGSVISIVVFLHCSRIYSCTCIYWGRHELNAWTRICVPASVSRAICCHFNRFIVLTRVYRALRRNIDYLSQWVIVYIYVWWRITMPDVRGTGNKLIELGLLSYGIPGRSLSLRRDRYTRRGV